MLFQNNIFMGCPKPLKNRDILDDSYRTTKNTSYLGVCSKESYLENSKANGLLFEHQINQK